MSSTAAAYAQLLSLGLVWISIHCSGMCGPLLIGFDVAGAARGSSALRGGLGVLTYQAGRAVTYVVLGVLAGLFGKGLGTFFESAGAIFALVFGVAVFATLMLRIWPQRQAAKRSAKLIPLSDTRLGRRDNPSISETSNPSISETSNPSISETSNPSISETSKGLVARIVEAVPRTLHPLAGGDETRHLRIFALGAAMGFLPCMITLWTLGLAATTGSPLHGAVLMLLLVAMTTPVLLGVTLLARVVPKRFGRALPGVLMALSAAWLLMVGLAGLGVVDHLHLSVGAYTLMLW